MLASLTLSVKLSLCSEVPFTFLPAHAESLSANCLLCIRCTGLYLLYMLVSRRLWVADSPDMAMAAAAGLPSAGNTSGILLQRLLLVPSSFREACALSSQDLQEMH